MGHIQQPPQRDFPLRWMGDCNRATVVLGCQRSSMLLGAPSPMSTDAAPRDRSMEDLLAGFDMFDALLSILSRRVSMLSCRLCWMVVFMCSFSPTGCYQNTL